MDANKKYYEKTKEKRKMKVKCDVCNRMIASDYLKKHQARSVCLSHGKTTD